MSEPTATEELQQHLPGRLEDFKRLTDTSSRRDPSAWETDDEQEVREEELYSYPLSVENFRTVKILLSTGGPADWLEIQLDEENEPRRIEYHFAPWFDHASVALEGDEYEAADAFARAITADYYTE